MTPDKELFFKIVHLIRCGVLPHLAPVQLLRECRRLPPRVPADQLHPSPAVAAAGAGIAAVSNAFFLTLPLAISFLFRRQVGKGFEGGTYVAAVSCFLSVRARVVCVPTYGRVRK